MAVDTETSSPIADAHSPAYVESILAQLDRLPTLKPVAMRLLHATTSDDTSAFDVVSIIRADASLSSALLRLLHRADRGVSRDVTDIERAVTLLGFSAVRNLVLTVAVFEALSSDEAAARTAARREAMWTHNLAVACAAELLADASGVVSLAGDAFLCGLLHDVGKLALDACFPKSYERTIVRVERQHRCICDAEHEVFGLDHTIAGKRLATHWGLAQPVVECVWLHHEPIDALPESVANAHLIGLIHLADGLVRQHGVGFSGFAGPVDVVRAASNVNVSPEALERVIRALPDRMAPMLEALGIRGGSVALSTEALLRANRQLGALNARLVEDNQVLERRGVVATCVERFAREVAGASGLGGLCAAAARTILESIGASACVVCVADEPASSAFVGLARADRVDPEQRQFDGGPLLDRLKTLADGSSGSVPLAAVEAGNEWNDPLGTLDPLLAAQSGWWRFPLLAGDELVGVALFSMGDRSGAVPRSMGEEWGAVSRAIGLAIQHTRARRAAERMSEQIVELNRRFRHAQVEVLRGKSVSMIAKMADGAAHELNNPLSVISGRAQLALRDCGDPELRRTLEIIVEQAKRAAGIATDLMDFAKPAAPHPTEQRLALLLEPACQHWRERYGLVGDRLRLAMADPAVVFLADAGQVHEALEAVVRNAIEAGGGKEVSVEINSPSRSSDETVRLVVRDDGPGMSGEVLEHALDPFFSHRAAGRSRGLGLSKAHRLIEINGGRLWIESIPNVGTTVTIELPAHTASP